MGQDDLDGLRGVGRRSHTPGEYTGYVPWPSRAGRSANRAGPPGGAVEVPVEPTSTWLEPRAGECAVPPRIDDLGRQRARQEQRHQFGEAVGPRRRAPRAGRRRAPRRSGRAGQHIEAGAQRTADGHRRSRGAGRTPGDGDHPVRLADQRRPQHVMDPAVDDRHRRARPLASVEDARHVRARRPDEEPAGLEQHPRTRPARTSPTRRSSRAEAAPSASRSSGASSSPYGIPSPPPPSTSASVHAGRGARAARRDRLADVSHEHVAVGTFDAPNAWTPEQLEVRRARRPPRGRSRSAVVHAELAGAAVADDPDRARGGALAGRARRSRTRIRPGGRSDRDRAERSSPGDSTVTTRSPQPTAAAQLRVALARAREDARAGRSRPAHEPRARRPTRCRRPGPATPGARRPPATGSP